MIEAKVFRELIRPHVTNLPQSATTVNIEMFVPPGNSHCQLPIASACRTRFPPAMATLQSARQSLSSETRTGHKNRENENNRDIGRGKYRYKTAGGLTLAAVKLTSVPLGSRCNVSYIKSEHDMLHHAWIDRRALLHCTFIHSRCNGVFWDVTPCGSCKKRRFGGN
jgi:hypothetical protein